MDRVALAMPDLRGNESRYVNEALRSTWISSTGEFVDRFERDFAAVCGTENALTTANGTVALHVALLALGAGPGDEVIVPSLTYVATANAVTYVGATPVFAEIDPRTWCVDVSHVSSLIGPRTVGIIPVHLYGHPADMDPLTALARKHGLWVVEDAAEAPFGRYRGRPTGSLGDIATFSFYGNKVITSGEGGAVTTNDQALASKMRLFRGQGMDPERRYFFPVIGHNFRLTNVAAALLCAQLERRLELLAARNRVVMAYQEALAGIEGIGMQPTADWAEWTPWLFSVVVDPEAFPCGRDSLIGHLASCGVETRPFFVPIHSLPAFRKESDRRRTTLPLTDALAGRGLNLPTHPQMSEFEIARVVGSIRGAASVT